MDSLGRYAKPMRYQRQAPQTPGDEVYPDPDQSPGLRNAYLDQITGKYHRNELHGQSQACAPAARAIPADPLQNMLPPNETTGENQKGCNKNMEMLYVWLPRVIHY